MLKGISRQIVEIADKDNPYFERAFFIVRSDCADHTPATLDKQARQLLSTHRPYSGLRRSRWVTTLRRIGLLAAGGWMGWLLSLLIQS